jgi:hypothetical protein
LGDVTEGALFSKRGNVRRRSNLGMKYQNGANYVGSYRNNKNNNDGGLANNGVK